MTNHSKVMCYDKKIKIKMTQVVFNVVWSTHTPQGHAEKWRC